MRSKGSTMSQDKARIREEAADWFMRQADPARADWDGFLAWLEADPTHNDAYEAVALADGAYAELVEDSRGTAPASNDNVPNRIRRGRWFTGIGSAAAAMVAGVVAWPLIVPTAATYAVETGAGERRAVTLEDGTRIEMNGDTKLTLRKGDARFAMLDRGEAAFTVVHDQAAPFEVQAGDTTLRDVGTVFNVVRSGSELEAAVAEGAVMLNPDVDAVRLDAGKIVRVSGQQVVVGKIDPSTVGTWRKDRLVYQNAPLSRIAEDLARNLGHPVLLAPELARERFSGVIILGEDRAHLRARIGALLDVDAVQNGRAWRLGPRKHASR
jgi:transmembrane sensor